jgi:hypothetical protein
MGFVKYFSRVDHFYFLSIMDLSSAKPSVAAPGAGLAGKPMEAQA